MDQDRKQALEVLKKAASHGAGPAGIFATAMGFFCDFVKPLMNLVPVFFVLSAIVAAVIWVAFISKGRKFTEINSLEEILQKKHGKAFGIAVLSTGFWLIMLPVFAVTPSEGVLASNVPAIGDFQEQVLGKLDRIESKIDEGFGKVMAKIDAIDAGAGIIQNPQSSNDFYHNAKVHELGGNMIEARKNYEKYFESNLSYIDPLLSYTQIIRALEGPTSVGEILGKLREKYVENPAVNLAFVLVKTAREDREFLLASAVQKFPDFGPNYVAIAELYSYKESGVVTIEEQKKSQEALGKAKELEEKNQGVSRFYIDKKVWSEKEEFLKSQSALQDSYYGSITKNPVDFKMEYVNGSVSLTFIPMETVKKIFYRIDGVGEFKDTGSMGIPMPGSAESLPNYSTIEALSVGKHMVEVKYMDAKGKESPVYTHEFEITPLKLSFMGYKIQNPKTGKAGPYVYYSFYRSEDSDGEVRYSIDSETYDLVSDGMIFLDSVAPGKHTVYVKSGSVKQKIEVEVS